MVSRGWRDGEEGQRLMGTESQFCKKKRAPEVAGGDGLGAPDLYTLGG